MTFAALAAAGAASVAVMLLVSVTRWFLPGVVELSSAFAVAGTLGLLTLAGRKGRAALYEWVGRISGRTMKYAAAGVAVLVLSAAVAVPVASFPWPVTLLAGVLIIFIGAADSGAKQGTSGNGGLRLDGPGPVAPVPVHDGSRRAGTLKPAALLPALARTPRHLRGTMRPAPAMRRCARPERHVHPVRRLRPVAGRRHMRPRTKTPPKSPLPANSGLPGQGRGPA